MKTTTKRLLLGLALVSSILPAQTTLCSADALAIHLAPVFEISEPLFPWLAFPGSEPSFPPPTYPGTVERPLDWPSDAILITPVNSNFPESGPRWNNPEPGLALIFPVQLEPFEPFERTGYPSVLPVLVPGPELGGGLPVIGPCTGSDPLGFCALFGLNVIPEPASWILLAAGCAVFVGIRKRNSPAAGDGSDPGRNQ